MSVVTVFAFTVILANNSVDAANPPSPKDYYFETEEDCKKGLKTIKNIDMPYSGSAEQTDSDADDKDKDKDKQDSGNPIVWISTSDCFKTLVVTPGAN